MTKVRLCCRFHKDVSEVEGIASLRNVLSNQNGNITLDISKQCGFFLITRPSNPFRKHSTDKFQQLCSESEAVY